MTTLEIRDLEVFYGSVRALEGVNLEINAGEIVALLGSNGAGKTTLLNTVAGLKSATSGSIVFDDTDITKLPSHKRARSGLVLVPEGRRIFPRMTVEENLLLGAWRRKDPRDDIRRVADLFPILAERRRAPGATLSGGEQQMLAIGRALMRQPRVLLLDEPSMGLAPTAVTRVFDLISEINRAGVTIFLVEQNAGVALRTASRGYVLERGRLVLHGSSNELRNNERVRSAYLGGQTSSS
jgi:branched-chain amino acid transport system ATP-binding protein